mmetsp:Transcript_15264/g.41111  ORF Transcript_15264/g.41111 Transcript_15264/m.41111 type:complete len:254 (+) Transcript_15264:2684-3445(+)
MCGIAPKRSWPAAQYAWPSAPRAATRPSRRPGAGVRKTLRNVHAMLLPVTRCVASVNGERTSAFNTRQKLCPCAAAGRAAVRCAVLCARGARSRHDAEALRRVAARRSVEMIKLAGGAFRRLLEARPIYSSPKVGSRVLERILMGDNDPSMLNVGAGATHGSVQVALVRVARGGRSGRVWLPRLLCGGFGAHTCKLFDAGPLVRSDARTLWGREENVFGFGPYTREHWYVCVVSVSAFWGCWFALGVQHVARP